jgi:hypothetical protein
VWLYRSMITDTSSQSANEARLFGGALNEKGQALLRFILRDGASVAIALDRDELAKLHSVAAALLTKTHEPN